MLKYLEGRNSRWVNSLILAQSSLLVLLVSVILVVITVRAAGQSAAYLSWAVFASLLLMGLGTALHTTKIGRLGGGHFLIVGVTPMYVAVSALALKEGGAGMLAVLIATASVVFFLVARWLPALRRIVTPVATGTLQMLIAVMVAPLGMVLMRIVPENAEPAASPVVAIAMVAVISIFIVGTPKTWRPFSLLAGLAAGCITAAFYGLYDFQLLSSARWFGLPDFQLPGLRFSFGIGFWALLPAFLLVAMVHAMRAIGNATMVQVASHAGKKAVDFRLVQGSTYAGGIGVLLAGIAGTPPTIGLPNLSVSLIRLTGIRTRKVGYLVAVAFTAIAFSPKLTGALLSLPSPVMGVCLLLALIRIFLLGLRMIRRSSIDRGQIFVALLAFAAGVATQLDIGVERLLPSPWNTLLGSSLTVGAILVVGLGALVEAMRGRSVRLDLPFEIINFPLIDGFLERIAAKAKWDAAASQRLRSAGEEAVASLLELSKQGESKKVPRLLISARPGRKVVEFEFILVFEGQNLEDQLLVLADLAKTVTESNISFRLLQHYATSVRHQQYQGLDIITVRVVK